MKTRHLFVAAVAAFGAESLPSQTPPRVSIEPGTVSYCSAQVLSWWRGLGNGGRITCAKDPTRPAILLVHGLHQNITTWTAPSAIGYSYDVSRDPGPERIGESHQEPGLGVYKIGTSPWAYGNDAAQWDRDHNWFDYLVALGFTVASWSQPGTSFQDAIPSAMLAFDSLLAQTKARNPGSPPPVALIGHSRGGLVIRKILKDRRTAGDIGRVKWVVTLHTPHQGSQLGEFPGRLVAETIDLMDCCAPAALTGPLKTQLKNVVVEAMRPMTKILVDFESRELTANSPMFRDLTSGETQLPGVKYFTFGGVNPTFYRLYSWVFDATSAVPQFKNLSQYFVWHVNPVALTPVSPVLDKIRPFVREVQAGYGDGLVTDASSRLPWSTHFTDHLNHAEVLWDRPLQTRVAQLIDQVGQSKPIIKPE
jgi:pimeloyl-ACP methyl ester carboxylesterase